MNKHNASLPFIQSAYLFDNSANLFKTFYIEPLTLEEQQLDKQHLELFYTFKKSGKDVAFFLQGESIYVTFTVYSDLMKDIGTIIFALNQPTINDIMKNVTQYERSFWFLFDKYDRIISSYSTENLSLEDKTAILNTFEKDAYTYKINGTSYLVYTEPMSMGLNATIGIPLNQLSGLMFESIKVYLYIIIFITVLLIFFTFLVIYKITMPLTEVTNKINILLKLSF